MITLLHFTTKKALGILVVVLHPSSYLQAQAILHELLALLYSVSFWLHWFSFNEKWLLSGCGAGLYARLLF
jgi:hypothetical protein